MCVCSAGFRSSDSLPWMLEQGGSHSSRDTLTSLDDWRSPWMENISSCKEPLQNNMGKKAFTRQHRWWPRWIHQSLSRRRRPGETQQSVETGGKWTMLPGFMLPSSQTPPVLPYGLLIFGDIPEIRRGSVKKKPNWLENLNKMIRKTQEGRGSQNLNGWACWTRLSLVFLVKAVIKEWKTPLTSSTFWATAGTHRSKHRGYKMPVNMPSVSGS